jgi:hypothetical protein
MVEEGIVPARERLTVSVDVLSFLLIEDGGVYDKREPAVRDIGIGKDCCELLQYFW